MAESSSGQQPKTHLPDFLQEEFERAAEGRMERERDHLLRHNLTLGGHAEEIGILSTNAENQEIKAYQKDKEERDRKFQNAMRTAQELHEIHVRRVQDDLARYDRMIEDNNRLIFLLESGQFDRSNQDHIALAEGLGIDPELSDEELQDALWENDERLRRERDVVAEHLERLDNASTPEEQEALREEYEAWREDSMVSQNPELRDQYTAFEDDQETIREIDEAAGFDDVEQERSADAIDVDALFSGAVNFGDGSVSFASSVEETSITTEFDLSAIFAGAVHGASDTDPDVGLQDQPAPQDDQPPIGSIGGPGG